MNIGFTESNLSIHRPFSSLHPASSSTMKAKPTGTILCPIETSTENSVNEYRIAHLQSPSQGQHLFFFPKLFSQLFLGPFPVPTATPCLPLQSFHQKLAPRCPHAPGYRFKPCPLIMRSIYFLKELINTPCSCASCLHGKGITVAALCNGITARVHAFLGSLSIGFICTMHFHRLSRVSVVELRSGLGDVPRDMMTASTSMV